MRRGPGCRFVAVVLAGLVGGVVLLPGAAQAHGGLVSTTPKHGDTVSSAPADVELTFTEKPSPFAYFTVTAPDGRRVDHGWSNAEPEPLAEPVREYQKVGGQWQPQFYRTGFPVRIAVAYWPAPGAYLVHFHTVATDGDEVKGDIRFTYAGAPTSAPPGWQAPVDGPRPELLGARGGSGGPGAGGASPISVVPLPEQEAGTSLWVWLVPALLVVAAGLVYLIVRPPAFVTAPKHRRTP